MLSKLSVATLALAATMVSAQTSTSCNPLEKTCPADPALGKNSIDCDFTKGACDGFTSLGTKINYDGQGGQFAMAKVGDAPTLQSKDYIFFGKVDVTMKGAAGPGIITSFVMLSDDLDEWDFEFVGNDNSQIQTNYFSKGNTTVYNRGGKSPVSNAFDQFHTYTYEWTPTQMQWQIDGNTVRTLEAASVGDQYPQTPMQVKIGAWVAGYKGNSPGTVTWAGGDADFSKGPAVAVYQSIKVVDYAGGSSPTDKDVKEYVYGDKSGSASSIQVKLNDGSSSSGGSSSSASSASQSSSATSATSSSESASSTSAATSAATTGATTMTTATSYSNSTGTSGASNTAATSSGASSTPTKATNAAPRAGLALGAVGLGALVALAL